MRKSGYRTVGNSMHGKVIAPLDQATLRGVVMQEQARTKVNGKRGGERENT